MAKVSPDFVTSRRVNSNELIIDEKLKKFIFLQNPITRIESGRVQEKERDFLKLVKLLVQVKTE